MPFGVKKKDVQANVGVQLSSQLPSRCSSERLTISGWRLAGRLLFVGPGGQEEEGRGALQSQRPSERPSPVRRGRLARDGATQGYV